MAVQVYNFELNKLNLTGSGYFNFVSTLTPTTIHEDTADVADELGFLQAVTGSLTATLPVDGFGQPIAELLGDSDNGGAGGIGDEYITIGGVNYNYSYLGFQTFPYVSTTGAASEDIFAVIQLSNGDYYALNLTNAGDPKNGNSGIGPGDLINQPLYFRNGVITPPCFTPGCAITTDRGELDVAELRVGDRILTVDNGYQPLMSIARRRFSAQDLHRHPDIRPIRIRAGALAPGFPKTDMVVSPQHRMLVSSRIAERIFHEHEILVSARKLIGLPGVSVVDTPSGVDYMHLLMEDHQLVFANGAPTETLLLGPEALRSISPAMHLELRTLFPGLFTPGWRTRVPVRPIARGKDLARLVARHVRHEKPMLVGG